MGSRSQFTINLESVGGMDGWIFRSQCDQQRRAVAHRHAAAQRRAAAPTVRSSRFELLEDRRMLTAVVGTLHSFDNSPTNAAYPVADLTLDGSTLFGTTSAGGADGAGTIFSMKDDGSNYQILYSFTGTGADGASPEAGLTLVGSTLYGTTQAGGTDGDGTIFSINTDGTGYLSRYSFTGTGTDGAYPESGLTLVGSTLYGTTQYGGSAGAGTVFSFDTGDSSEQAVYSFTGTGGANPGADLTLVGSALFGTTEAGGTAGDGTLFSVNTDGTGYQVWHSFTDTATDGGIPVAGLTLVGSALFGTTEYGGSAGDGTLFSIGTDGSDYTVLHSFTGFATTDGALPASDLLLDGSALFGTTSAGGADDAGTVFSMNTDGSGYTVLNSFTDTGTDGASPYASLTLVGTTLFGTTCEGGMDDNGTVFSMNADGTDYQVVHLFFNNADGAYPEAGLTLVGSTLYGTTDQGGSDDDGTIFSVNSDGSDYTVLYSFTDTGTDGASPEAGLTLVGSTLYGTTARGGTYGDGTIFSINTDGTGYLSRYSFTGTGTDGAYPASGLTLISSALFGTTNAGGSAGDGTVFSFDTDDNTEQVVHAFAGTDGTNPEAGLTLVGSTVFGTTSGGGTGGYGAVFSMNADGSGYQVVHSFSAADGASPSGLTLVGSTLFGTTYARGADGYGTVFSMNTDGSGYQVLHNFTDTGSDGAFSDSGLTLVGSTLYGTTQFGGTGGYGTMFSINTDETGYQPLYSFTNTGADGAYPYAGFTLVGSTLFGTTSWGGTEGGGTIYSVAGVVPTIVVTASSISPSYTVGGSAVYVDPTAKVSCSDTDLSGATVTVSAGTLQAGDNLSFTSPAGSGIGGSYAAGVLTLSGSATPAQYQAALRSVTYSNTTNSSTTTRDVTIAVSDSNDTGNTSGSATSTITVVAPITITAAYVSGSTWADTAGTANFDGYLATHGLGNGATPSLGYALQTGTAQLATLPWTNINTISVSFSGPVSNIGLGSLELVGGTGGGAVAPPSVTGFTSDGNNTYSWTLASPLGNNKYVMAIATTGSSFGTPGSTQVTDSQGAGISGKFTNSTSTPTTGQAFPSGNGLAGSTFDFFFNVLPGDGKQGGQVSSIDSSTPKSMLNDHETSAGYKPYFDYNGAGMINSLDASIAMSSLNIRQSNITGPTTTTAPIAPSGVQAGGTADVVGTTTGFTALALGVQETAGVSSSTAQASTTQATTGVTVVSASTTPASTTSDDDADDDGTGDDAGSSSTASACPAAASNTVASQTIQNQATDAAFSDFDLADAWV